MASHISAGRTQENAPRWLVVRGLCVLAQISCHIGVLLYYCAYILLCSIGMSLLATLYWLLWLLCTSPMSALSDLRNPPLRFRAGRGARRSLWTPMMMTTCRGGTKATRCVCVCVHVLCYPGQQPIMPTDVTLLQPRLGVDRPQASCVQREESFRL